MFPGNQCSSVFERAMTILLTLIFSLTLNFQCGNSALCQNHNDAELKATKQSPCSARAPEQERLLQNAAQNGYVTRRVDFWGNKKIRDLIFRHAIWLNEGDPFRYDDLQNSLKSLGKLKSIHRVKTTDVKASFDNDQKTIDFIFCLKEQERKNR